MTGIDEPDVRWEHYSHQQIWDLVHKGPGGAGSSNIDLVLDQVAASLSDAGDLVNTAVQKANAGDAWSGSAATSASGAMSTLRDFDDVTHGHSISTYSSTVGQAGVSSHARGAVPPVQARGMRSVSLAPDGILANTSNLNVQDTAAQQAQEQAREVMRAYTRQSTERVGGLPALAPTPKVVFRKGDSTTGEVTSPDTSSGAGGRSGVPIPGGATALSSSGAPAGQSPTQTQVQPEPIAASTTPSSATSPSTDAPGRNLRPGDLPRTPLIRETPQSGGSSSWRMPPAPTGEHPNSDARSARGFDGPSPEEPGPLGKRAPAPVSGPGEPGGSGRGMADGGARSLGASAEGAVLGRGGGRGAGPGMVGGGVGGRREDDEEHHRRYGLPTDAHFDADEDDYLRDPANREFYIAPDVIG